MHKIESEFQRVFKLLKISWFPYFDMDAKKIVGDETTLPAIIQSSMCQFQQLPNGMIEEYHSFYIFNNYNNTNVDNLEEVIPKYRELSNLIISILQNYNTYKIEITNNNKPTPKRDILNISDIGYEFFLTVTYYPPCSI